MFSAEVLQSIVVIILYFNFQFAAWVDAVIFVFSLENETSFNCVYDYYNKLCNYRNSAEIPIILVGTQGTFKILRTKQSLKWFFLTLRIIDAISERNPRIIDEERAKRLAHDLNKFNCTYFETCATYGLNVEKIFQDGKIFILLKVITI